MAEAVLQFTIKAKDEASRVVGAVTGKVRDDVTALDSTVGRLAQSFGFSDSKAAALAKTLPMVGAAAGAVAGIATAAAAAVFALAKNASDAGSEIFEAGQKSNLSAEFLSVLKVQAEQSGSTFEASTARVVKWSGSLVDAARGNKELTADLKRFGIDAAEAYRNPEAALKTFIESFNKLPPSAANNAAAMRLFKDRSGELIPVLRAFGDDYEGLVRKLDASGQIWTQEGTEKADEFGDALTEVGQIASGMANTFARETMPAITEAMKAISDSAIKNRDTFREWGREVGNVIRGIRELADSHLGTVVGWLAKVAYYTTPAAMLVGQTGAIGAAAGDTEAMKNFGPFGGRGVETPLTRGASAPLAPGDVTNEAAAKEAARKLEAARKDELRLLDAAERAKEQVYERAIRKYEDWNKDILRDIEETQKRIAQADREAANRRTDAFEAVHAAISNEIAILTEENVHLEQINDTIRRAEILGAIDARTAAFLRQLAAVNAIADKITNVMPVGGDVAIPQGAGPMVGSEDLAAMGAPPPPSFDLWKEALGGLKDAAGDAFGSITQGFGSMIHAFLMGEKLSGKAFAQMAKSAVAAIAAEAAVRALFELGMALASLWVNPAKAATHFAAAKTFGLVAGAAAVAALAIPGGGGAAFADNGSAGAGGSAFRTDERDRSISEGRRGGMSDPNQAQVMGYMAVDVKHDDGHVERQMVKVWRRMGEFRDTVMAGTVGTAPSY